MRALIYDSIGILVSWDRVGTSFLFAVQRDDGIDVVDVLTLVIGRVWGAKY